MNTLKNTISILLVLLLMVNCNSSKKVSSTPTNETLEHLKQNDTVKIVNDDIEYEITIIEPGFNFWLASTAKQRGYYSQEFLENRNRLYVIEWNQRVLQPQQYRPDLYELRIDYDSGIDYGYEVNYVLYNYFIYFQIKYKQRLGPFIPRI
jgi:hypothetical protein